MTHYLSATSMVVDENPYLREWIAFHRLVGVEHFFIYDNVSKVPVKEFLSDEVAEGLVTVVDFPERFAHNLSFTDALSRFGSLTRWMAFIDADEFIVPRSANDIPSVLKDFEPFGALAMNMLLFGSSGHEIRPDGLQIENFTSRVPYQHHVNTLVKCIVQTDKAIRAHHNHEFSYKPGFSAVNEKGSPSLSRSSPASFDKIQLNHYQLRSRQEFKEKLDRWVGSKYGIDAPTFPLHDGWCTEKDDAILKFVPEVRRVLSSARSKRA